MGQFKSKEFKALEALWYQKLAASGFNDIEDTETPERGLKAWHSAYFKARYTPDAFEAKRLYFELAQSFLHAHEFESEMERQVWELHCEGLSLRTIAGRIETKVCRIHKLIKRLTQLMFEEA